MAHPPEVPSPVHLQFEALGPPAPMRRGSLSERFMKCSKPGCACATDPTARHGPYYSLTRAIAGRTQSRLVSAAQARVVQRQVAAGQAFRAHLDAYWQACEAWADAELGGTTAAAGAAEKGGSRRRSPRRSRPRSRP